VLVGLSIGGLFAAQAYLAGAAADGLVFINMLRKPNQRLDWINQSMVRLARIGGGRLVMTANMPVIASPKLMAQMWDTTFVDEPYEAPAENDGLFRLMLGSLKTNWDFPYEKLDRPVLLLTGLYDKVFRIDKDIAELKARIPDAGELVYEDAGHLIPLEDPARFTGDLIAFGEHLRG
jgi:pimeloyl-ACP methyl ester carboxylesterase